MMKLPLLRRRRLDGIRGSILALALALWLMSRQKPDMGVLIDWSGNGHEGYFGGVRRAFIGDDHDGGRGLHCPGVAGNYGSAEEQFQRASDAAQNVAGTLTLAPRGLEGLRDAHTVLANDAETYLTTLLEGERENAWTRPEELDQAAWTKVRSSVTPNGATAPDGTATMDKLVEDGTAASSHYFTRSLAGTTDNTEQTISFSVQADERTDLGIQFQLKDASFTTRAEFNLATGAVYTQGVGQTVTITPEGAGTYRITATVDVLAGGTTPLIFVYLQDGRDISYNGDGSSGAFFWGLQFEVDAPFASSYTPGATTAAFTREADSLFKPYVDSAGDAIPPQEQTVYVKFVEQGTVLAGNGARVLEIGNAANPKLILWQNAGVYGAFYRLNAGSSAASATGVAPSLDDSVELLATLSGAGAVQASISVNGGATTVASAGADIGLAPAWGQARVDINANAGGDTGSNAFIQVTILAGTKSLAQCQAALRTDSDVLFWYEPGDDVFNASVVGDAFFQVFARAADWTPAGNGTLVAKFDGLTFPGNAYMLQLDSTGDLTLVLSDGAANGTAQSSVATGITNGDVGWLGATWRASDGRVQFFLGGSAAEPAWVQLGTDQSIATIAAINDNDKEVAIGHRSSAGTAQPFLDGNIYVTRIYSDLTETNKVVDVDFRTQAQGDRVFHSYNGALVEVNQAGSSTAEPELKFYDGTVFVWFPGTASNNAEITLTPTTTYDYTITYEDGSTDTDSQASDGGGVLTFGDADAKFADLDVRRIAVEPSGGGALVADLDFDLSTTVEQVASAAITINRSASGYKTTVVDENKAVGDGVDDYVSFDDHADLDAGATDDLTLVAAMRAHATLAQAGIMVKKTNLVDAGTAGYSLYTPATNPTPTMLVSDGVNNPSDASAAGVLGDRIIALGEREAGVTVEGFLDGVGDGGASDTSGDLSNAVDLRLMSDGAGANFYEGEWMSGGVLDRTLTAAQKLQLTQELAK